MRRARVPDADDDVHDLPPRLGRAGALAAALLTAAPAPAQTAPRKLGRGLAGMTTAFLEVPGNMVRETHRRGAAEGIPLGFAMGLGIIVPLSWRASM